ncbi:MAG: hypothetical protein ACK4E7_16030 [Permianibacter sp.]
MQKNVSVIAAAVLAVLAGASHAGDVTVSGFLTAGAGVADDDESENYAGYVEEDFTFDNDTVFGLQVSSAVNDKLTVTGQLIARGINDYEVDAEWAYLSYAVTDTFTWRMGRFRTPLYLYSDYVDVGYAFSWIRAPREVYYLPFNNVQGIDFIKQYSLGSWDGSIQGYFGALTDSFFNENLQAELSTELRNQMGLSFTIGNDWFTMRAAYHQAELALTGYEGNTIVPGAFCPSLQGVFGPTACTVSGFTDVVLPALGFNSNIDRLKTDDDGHFLALGFTIDTGTFVASGETIEFEIEDAPFSIDKRSYLMLGVRFGDFLLHATGARARDEAADLSSGITITNATDALIVGVLDGLAEATVEDSDTVSVGLRWDFTSSAAFKLQVDDYTNDVLGDQKVVSFAISTVF